MKKLDSRGITLVEIVAALAIFSIGTLVLLSGFMAVLNINELSTNRILATYELSENIYRNQNVQRVDDLVQIVIDGRRYEVGVEYAKAEDEKLGMALFEYREPSRLP